MKKTIILLIIYFASCICNGQNKMYVCDTISTVRIVCRDADYNKVVENGNVMNIEVFVGNDKIQEITYKYENTGAFTLKHFDLLDLNFDGYTDILISAGHTANRHQPFFDGYLWSETEHKFILEPQIKESMPNLLVDVDKKQIYSYYIVSNKIMYSIYKYQQHQYKLIGELNKLNAFDEHSKYEEMHYKNDKVKKIRCKKYKNLSSKWKGVLKFIDNKSNDL